MQKKILIPLLLLLTVSSVALGVSFSNPKNLPDTVEFPRIPMGDGTIGAVIGKILGTNDLGNYVGDGTVTNTLKLGGVTGTGYLKNTVCASNTEVWNGFDSNGKALCATKSTILAYYGQISEQTGTARIYRADGTPPIVAAIGTILKAGDIIKTDSASTLTIAFVDTSILRLDGDTTASLDISTISTEPNKQIASLILESGQVWGRILSPDTPTSTGYSLGSGDVVAGVRGTSIAIYKGAGVGTSPAWNPTTKKWILHIPTPSAPTDIAVVHSRLPANLTTGVAILTTRDGTKKIINPGEKVQYSTTASLLSTLVSPSNTSITDFYTSTPWIRDNTKKDLDYMKTLSGTIVAAKLGPLGTYGLMGTILPAELMSSSPSLNTEKNALCNAGFTFWNSLIGTKHDKCRNELAFADFTKLDLSSLGDTPAMRNQTFSTNSPEPMYLQDGSTGSTIIHGLSGKFTNTTDNDIQSTKGYKIEEYNEYISYDNMSLAGIGGLAGLAGKTITITLGDAVGNFPGTPGKYYIGDFGNFRIYQASGSFKTQVCNPTTGLCGIAGSISIPNPNIIQFTLPVNPAPNQMIIGNWFSYSGGTQGGYWNPIGTTIKGITIN